MENKTGISQTKQQEFEAILATLPLAMETLLLSHREVLAINDPIENQPGCESRVFKIQTTKGQKAARINFAQVSRDLAVPILIQSYLAKSGFAPEILGLIEGKELSQLKSINTAFANIQSPWPEIATAPPWSVLVMDLVEDGWNILQPERSKGSPPHFALWDQESILRQVRAIQTLATEVGIRIIDPQFLISKQGDVKLIDLDHCFFVDSNDHFWGYAGKYDEPLPAWLPQKELNNDFLFEVQKALNACAGS